MRRITASLLIMVGIAAFVVPPSAAAPPTQSTSELISLVNGFRASQGMPPFATEPSLMAAAQGHASWMAEGNPPGHTGAGGSRPQDRAAAAGYQGFAFENYAWGTVGYASVEWAVTWWSQSPAHRRNMLLDAPHAGFGVASNGSAEFFVLVIGKPSARAASGDDAAPEDGSQEPGDPADEPVVVVPITIATPRADGSVVHVVQDGQTAWAIGARYDVPLDDILALNYLERGDYVRPGDELYIKLGPGQPPPPSPTPQYVHIVQEGQTLWTIAALHGLSLDNLLALNGLKRGAVVKPGDKITIRLQPGQPPPPSPTPQTHHVVQDGQTLWTIAARYDLALDDLLALNGLERGAIIKPGDRLVIRAPDPTATPTPPPTVTPRPSDTPTATASPTPQDTPTPPPPVTTPLPNMTASVPPPRLSVTPGFTAATRTSALSATPQASATPPRVAALSLSATPHPDTSATGTVSGSDADRFDQAATVAVIIVGGMLAAGTGLAVWLMRRR